MDNKWYEYALDIIIYDEILMKTEHMTWNVPDKKV